MCADQQAICAGQYEINSVPKRGYHGLVIYYCGLPTLNISGFCLYSMEIFEKKKTMKKKVSEIFVYKLKLSDMSIKFINI